MISRVDYTALPSSFHSPSLFRGAPTHSRSPGARASESNNSGGRKADHTAWSVSPVSRPYTVGVGVGNPLMWLASNAMIYSFWNMPGSEDRRRMQQLRDSA